MTAQIVAVSMVGLIELGTLYSFYRQETHLIRRRAKRNRNNRK
jgi:hypothetical protein